MKTLPFLALTLLLWAAPGVRAAEIRFDGILGNSGAEGESLVQFGPIDSDNRANDSGLGYDRLGHLWSFGGQGRLIQYAADGRMTGSFQVAGKKSDRRSLVLVDDWVVVRTGEKLFRLSISATNGQQPEPLKSSATAISLNAVKGTIGVISSGQFATFDPVSDTIKSLGSVAEGTRGDGLILMPDGSLVVDGTWILRGGKPPEKINNLLSASSQLLGDYIYGFSWHMTVARSNLSFEPDPGVVFGGSSGYFIGSLLEDSELGYPRGIAHLDGNRFAIAGPFGIINLALWNAEKQAFEAVRRLGTVHFPAALAIDSSGRTWFFSGYWDWTDGPEHILRSPTNIGRECENSQAAVLASGQVVFPTMVQSKPKMVCRAFDEDDKKASFDVPGMPKDPTGLAILPAEKGNSEILVVNGKGEGVLVAMNPGGKLRKVIGPSALQLTSTSPKITSLAALGPDDLLASDGGFLVRLRRQGDNFVEFSRTNQVGGATALGSRIFLATAGKNLWISDTENNRVLHSIMDGDQYAAPAIFTGPAGSTALSSPQRISAAGDRAVVIDWNNQRIVKMSAGL